MARIRTIKPEFFTSEDIVGMTPYARLLYIAMWCEADKEGRLAWKPKTFKMRYLPADSINIDELCQEIVSAGLVVLYGDGLAYIPSFNKHQHINPRESASTLPDPHASTTRQPRVNHAPVTVESTVSDAQVGREGKGKISTRDASSTPDGVSDSVWQDFQKLRTKLKAPITPTALAGINREAGKAGISLNDALQMCCERSWRGFEADWVKGKPATVGGMLPGAI
jgi:hypothetical protein